MAASSGQSSANPINLSATQPQNLNTLLLGKLSAVVNGHAATATFACGGLIPISDLPKGIFALTQPSLSDGMLRPTMIRK